jgi:hypothetical protein
MSQTRLDVAHRNAPGAADYYFRTVLDGRHEWYVERRETKAPIMAFAICVIVLGALISLVQVLETVPWVRHLTGRRLVIDGDHGPSCITASPHRYRSPGPVI